MKSITEHTGTLRILERMNNSASGNPRYRIEIDGHECVTKPDSSYGYEITNHADKRVRAHIGTHYGKATLAALWKA
ncbi:MAG: hypothetical protein ACYTF7_11905 [Planctomycetota bacterium]|jgi:hypothetical protein